jgi:hypothetical protein
MELVAFLLRLGFGDADLTQVGNQPLENAPADFRMRIFPPAKEDRRFDLVALCQEALDVLLLELVVVLVDARAKLDLLDLDDLLMLFRLPRTLLLFVLVLPEVHDPADRRHGSGRDLDQVESLAAGDRQRLRRRHDPQLRACVIDHPDFANSDALVDADAIVASWAAVVSDNCLLD